MDSIVADLQNLVLDSKPKKTGLVNRGTGAGGANTNLSGKKFEEVTFNGKRLEDKGFVRREISKKSVYGYYLYKKTED